MTKQEIYDTVISKIRQQGGPSHDKEGFACYWGLFERVCPIAIFLEKNLYLNEISSYLIAKFLIHEKKLNYDFLEILREIHDSCLAEVRNKEFTSFSVFSKSRDERFLLKWKSKMRELGEFLQLSLEKLKEINENDARNSKNY